MIAGMKKIWLIFRSFAELPSWYHEKKGKEVPIASRGLYPKRIERSWPRLKILKFPTLRSIAEWRPVEKIAFIAGIIIAIVMMSIIVMTGKDHSALSITSWPMKSVVQETSGQKQIRIALAMTAPDSDLIPKPVTPELAPTDKFLEKSKPLKSVIPHQQGNRKSSPRAGKPKHHKPNALQVVVVPPIIPRPVETDGIGLLHVYTYPWAEMYVDNAYKGTTPTPNPILLTTGQHTLMLKHEGYTTYSETVYIDKGETTRIIIQMRTTTP